MSADRFPVGEPPLTCERGAIAHFAVDRDTLPRFDTANIVTDRLVLDWQLQNTIGGFAPSESVVR